MKRFLLVAAVAAFAWVAQDRFVDGDASAAGGSGAAPASSADTILAEAYADQRSDLQVEGRGTVVRVLPDDTNGSRHQRFILELDSGQTLLVAHNIDLAARLRDLRVGDVVAFRGEYEWSDKGGVIHWTHHDPQGRHPAGWVRRVDAATY